MGPTGPAGSGGTGSNCTPYNWGDTGPDGGKVFYVDGSGCHGLEAKAVEDIRSFTWSAAISAAAAYNTTTITGTSGLNCSTTAYPATPNCWHLPSKNELSWLYEMRAWTGMGNLFYWSSTEVFYGGVQDKAWNSGFNDGTENIVLKTTTARVRAVRAF
jgi:hypothetical protein